MNRSRQHVEDSASFIRLLIASAAGKIADQITNARTTLPWLLTQVGAPAYFLGLLVPLRESLSMLPQIFLSPLINRHARRKGFWIGAALVQAACLLAIPLCLLLPSPLLAAVWVTTLLALFSLARCFCSITFKDLSGKQIGSDRRGRLTGHATGIAGIAVIASGVALLLVDDDALNNAVIWGLFAAGAILWCSGATSLSGLRETEGQTDDHDGILAGIIRNYRLLRSDAGLRMLVTSRAFLLCPILAAPYLVSMADRDSTARLLGILILINGLASTLTAPAWGYLADHSSRRCMLIGGLLASGALFTAGLADLFPLPLDESPWQSLMLSCFALLTIGHTGIRTGRKTYTTNIAEGSTRTRYVSVSNSLIGIILLVIGFFGSLVATVSVTLLIILLASAGLVGSLVSLFMPGAAEENVPA